MRALLVAFALAAVLVGPALVWLFALTQRGALSAQSPHADSSQARLARRA